MIKTLRNKKGVTLVELLAVVVILGIIAAIAVPTIGGLIRRQEENAAQATYDTIVTAAELYAEDDTPFNLATLETEEFVDLKDNQFGWELDAVDIDAADVWVVVSGSTVTFYESDDVDVTDPDNPVLDGGAAADDLFINGYAVE